MGYVNIGKDVTGENLESCLDRTSYKSAKEFYSRAIDTRNAVYARNMWKTILREVGYYSLALPFVNDNDQIIKILSCITPSDPNLKTVDDWKNAEDIKKIRELDKFFN